MTAQRPWHAVTSRARVPWESSGNLFSLRMSRAIFDLVVLQGFARVKTCGRAIRLGGGAVTEPSVPVGMPLVWVSPKPATLTGMS